MSFVWDNVEISSSCQFEPFAGSRSGRMEPSAVFPFSVQTLRDSSNSGLPKCLALGHGEREEVQESV